MVSGQFWGRVSQRFPLLSFNSPQKQSEKERNLAAVPLFKARTALTVSLHTSLSEAHAVCECTASESPVREGANHPGSQSAQQPVRQRDEGGGR